MIATDLAMKETTELNQLFPSSQLKVIKLLGYSSSNQEQDYAKRYSLAKRPFMKGWQQMDKPGLSSDESERWINQGG